MKQLRDLALGMLAAIGLFGMIGCTVGPDYEPPTMEIPEQWPGQRAEDFDYYSDPNVQAWWSIFHDEDLDGLIRDALQSNRDLQAAVYRIETARAWRDYSTGQYYPTVDAAGDYTRSKASKDGAVQLPNTDPINLHSAGIEFAWEVDLFGRVRRAVESAQASYQASVEDYRNIMVSLLAEVARQYIDLRTTQARIAYAQANIEIQRQTLALAQNRFDAEIVSELDVRQAESTLANTEAQIPSLRIAEAQAYNRLAVLLGELPGEVKDRLSREKPLPQFDESFSIGMPVDLLRQRPDIRKAERLLAAQSARIGMTQAELYPSLRLLGTFEIQSRTFSGLGNIHNDAYAFGPGLRWNIFDANRIRNAVKAEQAGTQELWMLWQNTVLTAFEEVENAMVAYDQQKQRQNFLRISVAASQRSVQLTQDQYKSGLTDFENVLITQRALAAQQDSLAATDGAVLQAMVRLYKGFGAGWQMPLSEATASDDSFAVTTEIQH